MLVVVLALVCCRVPYEALVCRLFVPQIIVQGNLDLVALQFAIVLQLYDLAVLRIDLGPRMVVAGVAATTAAQFVVPLHAAF